MSATSNRRSQRWRSARSGCPDKSSATDRRRSGQFSGPAEPVVIGGGLLVLAWFERSRLVAVAVRRGAARDGVFPIGRLSMLLSAVIMFAAAIVALVRRSALAWSRRGHC